MGQNFPPSLRERAGFHSTTDCAHLSNSLLGCFYVLGLNFVPYSLPYYRYGIPINTALVRYGPGSTFYTLKCFCKWGHNFLGRFIKIKLNQNLNKHKTLIRHNAKNLINQIEVREIEQRIFWYFLRFSLLILQPILFFIVTCFKYSPFLQTFCFIYFSIFSFL